jgi:hypothetical protein
LADRPRNTPALYPIRRDSASVPGVTAELLLPAHKLLRDSPTEAQLLGTLGEILATDEMHGFRFPLGSEAEELMRTLEKTVSLGLSVTPFISFWSVNIP